jgi:O-antigen ligase
MKSPAFLCVVVFAGSALVLPALANAALIVAAGLLLARPAQAWQRCRGHPVWPVLGLALGYLLLHSLALGLSDDGLDVLLDLLKLLLFVPVGWALAGDPRRARLVLGAAAIGLLIRLLTHAPPMQWLAAFGDPARRLDFGFTAIASGLYCAAGLLGLVLLLPRCVPSSGFGRALTLLGGLLAAALLTAGLLLSRSRGTWLALLASAPLALSAPSRQGRWVLALFGAAALAVVLAGNGALTRRLADDAPAYAALAQAIGAPDAAAADAAWQQLPYNSVGLRLHVWRLAAAAWWQRPWFGHGPDATETLLASAADSPLGELAHLHNTYAELALRFGLVGLALAVALVWALAAGVGRRLREEPAMADLARFLAGALVLTAVWSVADFRLFRLDFRLYAVLLGGVAFGLGLPRQEAACAS